MWATLAETAVRGCAVADSSAYKILVIDDEAATLTMFRLFLTAYGFQVWVAEDGEAGLALARRHRPDIVFTDLKMPTMDGFEVLKEIKHMAPDTEVIVITGHGDMDLIVQALNLDATDFINKPISRTALEAALRRATERLQQPVPDTGRIDFAVDGQGVGRFRIYGTLRRQNREQLVNGCRQARALNPAAVLFQFMDNAAVDGPGIAELINCLSAIRKNNQRVAVMGLSENFKVIFETVGVARFAALCDTEQEALAAIGVA
jgi:CheY-like chemotaxis protein/anti-anti-sigma regulatory factor